MSILKKTKADVALANALNGKVVVHTSADVSHPIKAYKQGKQPNKGVGSEFILVQQNGVISSPDKPMNYFTGNIAVEVRCKLQSNNTTKDNIIDEILMQIEEIAHCKSYGGFYYEMEADNVIVPTTPNLTEGYSTTVINVKWHTSNNL